MGGWSDKASEDILVKLRSEESVEVSEVTSRGKAFLHRGIYKKKN